MIDRVAYNKLSNYINSEKVVILFGPRQVGKTTLLDNFFENIDNNDILWLNGDEQDTIDLFKNFNKNHFYQHIEDCKYLVIDEAQRIENIGLILKIIYDNFKHKIQIVATGSSSFDLANKINEPLTGRKWEIQMFPLTINEMIAYHGITKEKLYLENRLLYGWYPAVVNHEENQEEYIKSIVNGNLYKDILKWGNIQKSDKLTSLLKALAYQIGSQVSYTEIGHLIDLDPKTVEKYISLLEQSFIIFRANSFSRNLRNELKSSHKYFFYDVGVRNALIEDFTPISIRKDIGALFENFVISELVKKNPSITNGKACYFWRDKQQHEIDYIDDRNGQVLAYEIKWNPKSKVKFPKAFMESYDPITKIIHRDNFWEVML